MPLYNVTIERITDICVWADNEKEAKQLALSNERDEIDNGSTSECVTATKIESKKDIPDGWKDCFPYGRPTNKTVSKIVEEMVK